MNMECEHGSCGCPMHQEQEQPTVKYDYSVAVRFKNATKPYSFGCDTADIKKGSWVVVETAQGIEMGEVDADALCIERYNLHMPTKPIIRIATEKDQKMYAENAIAESEAYRICNEEIQSLNLDMNLMSAQYTLDRSKVLFVYLADQRVDFRELLKVLGTRLHCRIELRQIGERDKAKMVGGIGMCGMETCCSRYKNHFDVISINMAKTQQLALNVEKLSGMCGKLMCCLKYEENDYKELTAGLPKMGSQVEYDGMVYRLTNMNVMKQEAKLENREQVLFISLENLREKAIPRKGFVQQNNNQKSDKQVHRTTVHEGVAAPVNKDKAVHVSIDLPTVKVESSKPQNNRPNNNNKKPSRNHSNKQSQPRPNVEKNTADRKNVTVRTFGRKKKDEGDNA